MKEILLRIICFCLLTVLATSTTFAQIIDFNRENPYRKVFVETDDFSTSYLDTLEQALPKVKIDSIRFSILNDLAYYWHTRDLVKALDFTKQGLALTRSKEDTLWNGRFQITEGAILLRMEKLEEAEQVLICARGKVLEIDLPLLNTQLGYVYERRGQLDKAADFALETLNLGKKLNDKWAMAMAYSDLSNLFWKQSKFEAGLEYGIKSLKAFEAGNINGLDYSFTLFVVANNYLALKEHDEALSHFRHSIAVGERYGFYNNLSDIYISMVDFYIDRDEPKKAEEAGENALKYAELLHNNFMVMRCWLTLGKLQNLQGHFTSAIESLHKCIAIATKDFGDTFQLSQAYEALSSAYAGNNNYEKAYGAYARHDSLKSKIFTAEADHRISLLRTEFDVANKESTILIQEAQIQKQRNGQLLISIITALLLLLLLLSYKTIRNKFKVNQLLRKQNSEKEFLLKEIHHRVKNNLEIISSLLSLQSAQIEDADLSNVMTESKHRVQSMGMIHQKLYMGEDMAAVEMKDYFINLTAYIQDSFGMRDQVQVEVMMDEISLDVDVAIPIGLIVNELLTNSFKYAFPDMREGKIVIRLVQSEGLLHLKVTDNGIGTGSEGHVIGTGFGTQLIALLTKQLDGQMVLETTDGTSVSIQFNHSKAA